MADGRQVINFCANNYLGLANHPELIAAAKAGMDSHGFGMASVRFICGTQDNHKQLEQKLADFLGMEDAILYSSCFDANGGLFETLLGPEDAIISDALNHASIIDGVRLCKAKRYRYANNDMGQLAEQLQQAKADGARHIMIATDGVFSMDGVIANLKGVCDLADQYDALVMVDDSHAVGFVGANGRGTHEYCEVMDRVDIITGTLGKALGGASGGYTAGKRGGGVVASAFTPLSVLQLAGSGHCGSLDQSVGTARRRGRPARSPVGQCQPVPRKNDRSGLYACRGRSRHHPGDVG